MNRIRTWLVLLLLSVASLRVQAQPAMSYGFTMQSQANPGLIHFVYPGSPADKAGLKTGDKIITVAGKPVVGLSNERVVALVRAMANADLTITRSGATMNFSMSKAPLYTFDRLCLSGNCVDGFGRAVFPPNDSTEYEASFNEGEIVGDSKMYRRNGPLIYTGTLKSRRPEGNGKMYGQAADGKTVLLKEGTFTKGALVSGSTYNRDGSLQSSGRYDESGRVTDGYFRRGDRTPYVWYICSDIRYVDVDKEPEVFYGLLQTREADPKTGRLFTEGTYDKGMRNGLIKVWDYSLGVRHEISYAYGIPSKGTIYRLSDNSVLGREVQYKKEVPEWMVASAIQGGYFRFGAAEKAVSLPAGSSASLSGISKSLTGEEMPMAESGQSKKSTTQGNATRTPEHLAQFKRERDRYNYGNIIDGITNSLQEINSIRKSLTQYNYETSKMSFDYYKKKIISDVNKALYDWGDEFPAEYVNKLREIRDNVGPRALPPKETLPAN